MKELLRHDQDFIRAALEALLQAVLEAEMTEAIGAEKLQAIVELDLDEPVTVEPPHAFGRD